MRKARSDRWLVAAGMLAFLVLLGGCGGSESEQRVIRLGHGLDPSHPVHKAMEFMAKRLREKSDERLRMEIYPSEQLGSERECLELLQIGSLGMTKVSSAVMEGFSPLYKVYGLPYLFESEKHRFDVLRGSIGKRILKSSTDDWLRGMGYYDAGSRSFYTQDTPVRTPEDLEGLKIRVMESPIAIRTVNMLGASATPISWGELYTSLQQGVVDGAENNAPSFHLSNHYEVTGYYSLDEHAALPDVLLMSTHLWNDLSEQEKTWVEEAVRESTEYQRKLWDEATQKAMRAVKEAGIKVIRPDKEPFREAVQPLYEQIQQESPKVYELAQQVREEAAS